MNNTTGNTAFFRFYEELNDFLPSEKRKLQAPYHFSGKPSIKDAIEAQGIPHPEVDLIIVNGDSVGFDYHLQDGDQVAVYPVFESFDISPIVKLREAPLRVSRFVVDVNLGKLARLLRMLGFDTLYDNQFSDRAVAEISSREQRIVLTRDRRMLQARIITHGYWVRSQLPEEQIREVIKRFDLFSQIAPFRRCFECNGLIQGIDKTQIIERLQPKTRRYYEEFYICPDCEKIYWEGSHFDRLRPTVEALLTQDQTQTESPD